jgi:hypothetical protein
MMTEEYDDKAGRRVWLSRSEVEQLLNVADDPLRKVAFRLAAEVGLRSHEVGEVRPEHVVDGGEAGKVLVVPGGRGDKLREAPIPDSLADTVDAAASFGGVDDDEVLVNRSTRSVRNWVEAAREETVDDSERQSGVDDTGSVARVAAKESGEPAPGGVERRRGDERRPQRDVEPSHERVRPRDRGQSEHDGERPRVVPRRDSLPAAGSHRHPSRPLHLLVLETQSTLAGREVGLGSATG